VTRAAWLTLALTWAGCSWLVNPNDKAPLCSTEQDATPCADGCECKDGHCVATAAGCGSEICGNGEDDDCDGETDERIQGGADRCGDLDDNDCDGKIDEDPNPERKEACGNAIDDDCDGKTDEQPDPSRPEACGNAADDDCDGNVDEGHDQDNDGNQWCGDTRKPASEAHPDCDD
jgi:hypothetical protein